ncbi:MAG: hypothetical protein WAT36_09860 [Chromatiaceae bacterium]
MNKQLLQAGVWLAITGFSLLASTGSAVAAKVDGYDGQWHYNFTPYLWFPNIEQRLQHTNPWGGGKSVEVEVKPDSYLGNLKFGLMGTLEARKGNWSLVTDLIYTDFGHQDGQIKQVQGPLGAEPIAIDRDVDVKIQALIWQGAAGYTLARGAAGTLDLLGGVRYLGMDTETGLSFSGPDGILSPSISRSQRLDIWDGFVGVRGELFLDDAHQWFLPYYLDVGVGNYSNWTWQGLVGLGYRLDWGDLLLAFRTLNYATTGDEVLQKVSMTGPALGVTFHW